MAQTGHTICKDGSVKLVCGAGTLALTADGNNVTINSDADDLESTNYGDQSHTFFSSLTAYTLDFGGWWSGSHTSDVNNSIAACLLKLQYNNAASKPVIWVAPAGSTAGSLTYLACVNVKTYNISFPVEGVATMSITMTARNGSLSASQYAWT